MFSVIIVYNYFLFTYWVIKLTFTINERYILEMYILIQI